MPQTVDVAGYYEERWQSGAARVCVGKRTVELQDSKAAMSLKPLVEKESEGEKGKVLLIITLAFMGNICGV